MCKRTATHRAYGGMSHTPSCDIGKHHIPPCVKINLRNNLSISAAEYHSLTDPMNGRLEEAMRRVLEQHG